VPTQGCPHCGQKLRQAWRRCPRCRHLIAEVAPGAVANTSDGPGKISRPVLAAALIVAGTMGVPLLRSAIDSAPPAGAATTSLGTERSTDRRQAEPRPIDAREASANQAVDSLRGGNAAYAQGDLAGALSRYEAAVKAAPGDPEAHNNLAQLLVRQGRTGEALPHLDEAIRLDSNEWSYRFNRARALGLLSRWQEAVAEYRAALQLFPDDYATHYNLGLAHIRLRQYTEAVQALKRAVQLAPGEHSFLVTLGNAYLGAQQIDQARATFEQFLAQAPTAPDAPRVKAQIEALTSAR
jgi:tetratricopeptide (TPR) repeat protein